MGERKGEQKGWNAKGDVELKGEYWQAELHKQLNIHYPYEIERLSPGQKIFFYLTEPLVLLLLDVGFCKGCITKRLLCIALQMCHIMILYVMTAL